MVVVAGRKVGPWAWFLSVEHDGEVLLYYFGNVRDTKGQPVDKFMVEVTAKNVPKGTSVSGLIAHTLIVTIFLMATAPTIWRMPATIVIFLPIGVVNSRLTYAGFIE